MLYSLQRDKSKSRSAFSIIDELLRLVPAWIVCEIPLNDLASQQTLRLCHKESDRQFCGFGENVQGFLQGAQGLITRLQWGVAFPKSVSESVGSTLVIACIYLSVFVLSVERSHQVAGGAKFL